MRWVLLLVFFSGCATTKGADQKSEAPYEATLAQRAVIAKTIRGHLATLQQCARRHLVEGDPSSAIGVTFGIDQQGRAVYPHAVDNSLPSSAMVECVLATFRRMSFPEAAGNGLLDFTSARIVFDAFAEYASPVCDVDAPPAVAEKALEGSDASDNDALWRQLRENERALRLCYGLDALDTVGSMSLNMDVDSAGVPADVGVMDSTLSSAKAVDCVVDALKALRFPAHRTRSFRFPLRFTDEHCSPAFVMQEPPDEPGKATKAEREEFGRVLSANIKSVTSCYERSLMREPSAASGGYIVVAFGIDRTGRVIHPHVPARSLTSEPAIACMLKAFAQLKLKPRATSTRPDYGTYVMSFVLLGSDGPPPQ